MPLFESTVRNAIREQSVRRVCEKICNAEDHFERAISRSFDSNLFYSRINWTISPDSLALSTIIAVIKHKFDES